MGTGSSLVANMYAVAVFAAVLVAVSAQAAPNVCVLSSIPVQANFSPERWRGAWFEAFFYPRQTYDRSDYYEDYVYEVTPIPGTLDMQIKELTKDNRVATLPNGCRIANDARRYYEANAKYYYYKSQTRQNNVRSWIVETDYTSYAIEFLCYNVRGNTCLDSEISLWTRTPGNSNIRIKDDVRRRFMALHSQFACIKLNDVKEIKHNYLSNLQGACTRLPTTVVPGTPNILHPNFSPFYNYNFMMDPALLAALKAQLIALKEKLIEEKQYFDLLAEKTRLEVQILRRGGVLPK